MGKVIHMKFHREHVEETGEEIEFYDGEFRLDDRGCGLVVIVSDQTVRRKLKKISAQKVEVGQDGTDLSGVNYQFFLDLNIKATKSGRRSPSAILSIKRSLESLKLQYGEQMVNAAISKLKTPGHATIPYLKGILRNMRGSYVKDDGYTSGIERAVANLYSVRSED